MADENTRLASALALHSALQQYRITESWEAFRDKFLRELVQALEKNRTFIELGANLTPYEVEPILHSLREYFREETYFRRLVGRWVGRPWSAIITDNPQAAELFRTLERLDYTAGNPARIEEAIRHIDAIMASAEAGEAEPSDKEAVRTRLLELLDPKGHLFIGIDALRPDLQELLNSELDDFEPDARLERSSEVALALRTTPELDRPDKEAQVRTIEERIQQKLAEALKTLLEENWESFLRENPRHRPVAAAVRDPGNLKDEDLTTALVDALMEFDQPPTPLAAVNEAEIYFDDQFLPNLERVLETLKQKRTELIEKHQQELDSALRAVFALPEPSAPEGGGEAGAEEEAPPVPEKPETVESARQQLLGFAARFAAIGDVQTRIDIGEALTIIGQQLGIFRAGAQFYGDIQSIFEIGFLDELDRRERDAAVAPADFQQWADALVAAVAEVAEDYAPEGAPQPEAPVAVPGELSTATPEEAALPDDVARKSVGELMEAQQLLVRQGMEELRAALKKAKVPSAEIEEIIQRNRDTLSQQIWLEFLQRGGLTGDLEFAQMATIWSGVVQHNLQRILIETNRAPGPLLAGGIAADPRQTDRLVKIFEQAGYSTTQIKDIFANLNKDTFERLADFADKESKLSPEQRRIALMGLLQKLGFAQTDAASAAALIADENFYGLLKLQLEKEPPILSLIDRRNLRSLLEKTDLSRRDQQELARIVSVLMAKYPPEVFAHLGASELAQIHEFLARQQRAMEIIGQQLQGRGGFTNPYFGPRTGGADTRLARSQTVTETEVTQTTKDTLMLELTLSLAFETRQDVHMSLILQQYYADPQKGLAWLASGLGEAYDDDGGLRPELSGPATPQAMGQLAALQRQNYAQLAQRQRAAAAAKQQQEAAQAQALLMAVLASGGNPALLAKNLLTDPNARAALMGIIEKHKYEILAIGALQALPGIALLGMMQAVWKFFAGIVEGIGNFVSGVGQGISGFFSGLSGSSAAGLSGAAAVGFETGANVATTTQVASSQALPALTNTGGSLVTGTFNGTNAFLAGTSVATTPALAVAGALVGPMALSVIMTFIVFSVIAGSLNGLTTEVGRLGIPGIGRNGCWPVDGSITTLESYADGTRHDTSPGGTAVDIGAPIGRPIYSPFSGTARARYVADRSAPNWGYGLFVDLRTEFGFRVIFAHMSAFKPGIRNGETFTVNAGDVVGLVGSTGASSGPHVHYESIGPNLYNLLPVARNLLSIGYRTSTSECRTTQPAQTIGGETRTLE